MGKQEVFWVDIEGGVLIWVHGIWAPKMMSAIKIKTDF